MTPGGRGDEPGVVGRGVRGVPYVVARHVLRFPVRCGCGGEWLRVVVGSQARGARAAGCGFGAGSFVVERRGAGARFGNRRCGSQRGVTLRPCRRDARGTVETGCGDRGTARRRTLEMGCVGSGTRAGWRTVEIGCVDRGTARRRTVETGCVWSPMKGVRGTVETGCVEARDDTNACERVTFSSGSTGVGA